MTIQEHYDIHHSQGDWGACFKMAKRMEVTPEVTSRLASLASKKRVAEGTHNFQDENFNTKHGSVNQRNRVLSGKHNFLGSGLQKSRIDNGTHPFLKQNRTKYVGFAPEKARKVQQDLIKAGTHTGTKQFAQPHSCSHCGKEGKGLIMFRFHFDNCKYKPVAIDH